MEENFEEEEIEEKEDNRSGKESVAKEIWSWIRIIIIALLLAYFINNFIIINANIPSASMENTVMTGDRIIGFRLAYLFEDVERGDIVIFKYPKNESETYIKRVIGLPGETVMINEDGSVSIKLETGTVIDLDESYIKEDMNECEYAEYSVGENEYFMMGDNRNDSSDSRVWGCVRKDQILAKALYRYWPFSEMGSIE